MIKVNKFKKDLNKLGNIIVISAPSGAGKTTICDAIVRSDKNVVRSVSYTTRSPRKGEKNSIEYFFVKETEFKQMIKEKRFVEYAKVHNNYYGTSKDFVDKTLKSSKNVLLEIDVQGGLKIKKQYPQSCMIFIMTKNLNILKQRLISRNKDCTETINIRLKNAKKEIQCLKKYEYLVINDNLEKAIDSVKTIIKSLKYKIIANQNYFI
ncbi:MAG: guanylate kinase [Endomicrobium sp.]|jgi:guanylate kinase|nr:guanylate kinase [Endomicrobium sp.]